MPKNNHHSEPSAYQEGKTKMTSDQKELLQELAWVVYHDREYFNNLLHSYAPTGLIGILYSQVEVRYANESISKADRDHAVVLIQKLSELITV